MAIEVGDAVYRFLGDTQNIDRAFQHIDDGVKSLPPVPDEVPESIKLTGEQLREARGEARLLGEEFGIRLPRHVSNFLATLPGVGEAMSAAFSATAILFVAQALVQASDKLSNFVGNTLIFTDAMRDSNTEVANENKTLLALAGIYNTAKEKLEELNGVTKSWEQSQRDAAQATIEAAKAELAQMQATIANKSGWDKAKDTMKDVAGTILGQVIPSYFRLNSAAQDQIAIQEKQAAVTTITAQALRATNEVNAEEAAKNAKLAIDNSLRELENQKKVALAYAQNDQERFELDQAFEEKRLALLNSYAVKDVASIKALMTTIEVEQVQHAEKVSAAFVKMLQTVQDAKTHALDALKDSTLANIIELTPLEQAFVKAEDAARSMGITLQTDLVEALDKAKTAEAAFAQSGIVDKTAMEAFQKATADAQKALDNYGKTQDTFLSKSRAWKEFQEQMAGGAHGIDQLKLSGVAAFDDLSKNIEGAFSAIVLGQGNVVQALEKATAASLAQIAAQAAVKALFYTGEGIASLFTDPPAAAGFFEAAGLMAAVAGVAGVAGHELAGAAGGGSSNTEQGHTSQSNTGSSGGGSNNTVGVQHFALGGLITAPTLAMIGEQNRKEAVLPLEDPRAMKTIGEALGGGGGNIHVHVAGLISPDNLTKVVEKINKRVNRGQLHLNSSSTLRVTKRSA